MSDVRQPYWDDRAKTAEENSILARCERRTCYVADPARKRLCLEMEQRGLVTCVEGDGADRGFLLVTDKRPAGGAPGGDEAA